MRLTTSHCKNKGVQKHHTGPRNWTDNFEQPWQRKMGMRFGTWNVRSLHRAGALGLVTSEILVAKYRMDLVGVQEVRWEGSGTLESGNYTLFYANLSSFPESAGCFRLCYRTLISCWPSKDDQDFCNNCHT